jgi:hypothetical protein
VAQADFGRNLKPAPAAKLFVSSDFFIRFGFPESVFRFLHLKSTPCGAKSTIVVASKVRFTWQSKVDFGSQVASQSSLRAATNKVDFSFKVAFQSPFTRHPKVDFGFQVASQSPLRAAQSRLRFLSRILKSALSASKVYFGRI